MPAVRARAMGGALPSRAALAGHRAHRLTSRSPRIDPGLPLLGGQRLWWLVLALLLPWGAGLGTGSVAPTADARTGLQAFSGNGPAGADQRADFIAERLRAQRGGFRLVADGLAGACAATAPPRGRHAWQPAVPATVARHARASLYQARAPPRA